MKKENLEQDTGLANKIRNLDLLLSGKQANCWFSVTNRDGDVYTFNEDCSKKIQTILEKERDRLIVEYGRLDRE